MPQGVEVFVEDGVATVEFVDPAQRAAGLNALLQAGGDQVQKVTRPRPGYVVPEGVARAAGMLDEAADDPDDSDDTDDAPADDDTPDPDDSGDADGAKQEADSDDAGDGAGDADGSLPVNKTWPDGEPDADWRRDDLNDYAKANHNLDTRELPNRAAVVKAINDAASKGIDQ